MIETITYPEKTGTTSSKQVILEVRQLTKRFPIGNALKLKQVHALTDATFTISRGEVVALVGESGSGKSTTARLITRLIEPTRGEILLHGQDVLKTEPRGASQNYRRMIQMIFQDPYGSLNPARTIGFHVERPIKIHQRSQHAAQAVLELLASVGLNPAEEFARKYPYQLSGGQRQRVAVARALAVEPELILADEPISMLDVSIRMGVLNLIEQLKEERGIGFLYITHDLASARYIGDRTIVMYAGHMVECAESTVLMEQPAHPYTKLLLSAVPNPEAGLSTKTVQARGEIPSLIDPPPGCPFAPRCPRVMDVCRQVMPAATNLTEHHWVRCHLFGSS
ncbi:MAG: ABC transporter ATP-binding protein [Anaerolineales bacterium]|jgi:peptide/nickel transport system ATP-binding protein|nr:ABC transporter ATP-binding protein [Anaerolineales bacterium]